MWFVRLKMRETQAALSHAVHWMAFGWPASQEVERRAKRHVKHEYMKKRKMVEFEVCYRKILATNLQQMAFARGGSQLCVWFSLAFCHRLCPSRPAHLGMRIGSSYKMAKGHGYHGNILLLRSFFFLAQMLTEMERGLSSICAQDLAG